MAKNKRGKSHRGFAAMDKAKGIKIASNGGRAVSKGPKGRKHMAELGRMGARAKKKNRLLKAA